MSPRPSALFPRGLFVAAFLVALILQLGVALRQGLWSDEIFSLAVATGHSLEHPASAAEPARGDFVETKGAQTAATFQRYLSPDTPPANIARVVRAVLLSDTSPPFYYVLLHGWTRLTGTSDFALRAFSMLCALACLPFLAGVARRTDAGGAWFAPGLLFAIAPLGVYYATEVRMYSLLWLLVCAFMWLTLRLQETPRGWPASSAWTLVAAAGLLTHYFFAFPLAAAALYLFWQPGADTRARLVIRCVLAGALVTPWYWHLPASLHAWRISGGWLNDPPGGYSAWSNGRDLVLQFFSSRNLGLWFTPLPAWLLATVALGLVAVIALVRAKRTLFAGPRLLLWLWFAAPLAGALVFDAWQHTYVSTHARYVSAALPAACLLAGLWLAALPARAQLIALAVVAVGWGFALRNIHQTRWRNGLPMREVAHTLSARTTADDLVMVHGIPSGVLGFSRYARPDTPVATWVAQLDQHADPAADAAALAHGRKRVFLLHLHDLGAPAPEEDWLRAHGELVREDQRGHARWSEFRPRSRERF